MSDIAIQVENLGKQYRIGGQQARYKRFTETLMDTLTAPVQRLRRLGRPAPPEEMIWALKDISFEVRQGEVVGIIGRNGAGKSTLLKVLSRITEPTEGEARVYGRVGSLLEVGTGFHPELTGRENIYLNGTILGMKRAEIERKFDEIVAFAEIEKFLDTPVKRYSSGMYVRLAFAVAAHLEPEVLIVDEVLAVGDVQFQKKCMGKMGEVAKGGRTVLFVSHNMAAVASLCQSGILLEASKFKATGDLGTVVQEYMQNYEELTTSADLRDHPRRSKEFKPLLTSFVVEVSKQTAYYAQPLTLRIGYDVDERIATPQFCAIFRTLSGIKAFTLISDYQPSEIPSVLQGKGEVICRIDSLPLIPGTYIIDLKLWQPGQKLDEIENVALLQVEWLDRSYGQFNWDSSMGVVYVDATWSLVSPD